MDLSNDYKLIRPIVSVLSQGYGRESTAQWILPMYEQMGMKGHNGLDLAAPLGTNIYAPCRMKVIGVDKDNRGTAYGLHVRGESPVLRDKYVLEIILGHFDSVKDSIKIGDWVEKEDLLGKCGCTGQCTGPHVHLGIRVKIAGGGVLDYNNGYFGYVDPTPYLEGSPLDLDRIYTQYNGKLIKSLDSPKVYLLENKTKRWFESEEHLWSHGYILWGTGSEEIIKLASFELNAIPNGVDMGKGKFWEHNQRMKNEYINYLKK